MSVLQNWPITHLNATFQCGALTISLKADKGSPEEEQALPDMQRIITGLEWNRIPHEVTSRNAPHGDKPDRVKFWLLGSDGGLMG